MDIEKAIEILTILESRSTNNSTMFKKDALRLGVEALKFIKQYRHDTCNWDPKLLPGETERRE